MLKYFFTFFLVIVFAVTGFCTFLYFATEEYDGTGMLYLVNPYISIAN
ncbi:hypothetical protein CON65_25495 [Bacillus pseudomycoides]|uniref:Uncharacterized protein n=1 Tax=Bacillus pseudomycoides TaxID=64104 RepID=A0AA91ZQZ1_9BACI|nr:MULTISPECIES: hypothetical protein [Bacillus]PEB50682.1 hypothetical protein COO03_20875 [Bacillus sp. AFS098217]PED79947.1 hypothetical protein CON65_25495 [Bacillus pseudomycoides]PEU16585.1 hypothetical protein CN524_03965 [Bacillus sp. AFS019443]PEU21840.1 hypothetical protein CN525_01140 [Bacillus sp. AFS014408]PFW60701.1 hypothetical protein COL20_21040 [Bacillus sp. AFS075034]